MQSRPIQFLDLKVDLKEKEELLAAIGSVFDSGKLVDGPEIESFESAIANHVGRQYCCAVGSGSAALHIALLALGVGRGDEVVTTSLSWIATANAIALSGATPVFADIDESLNLNPESVQRLITPKTKAVLAVDYTGKLADYESLLKICNTHDVALLEDGSQAFGSKRDGIRCGAFGVISAISHNPMKVFAGTGEAGSVLVDDPELKAKLDILRYNGTKNKEHLVTPSINARMDTIQAAVLKYRLPHVDNIIKKRTENAAIYIKRLADSEINLPEVSDNEVHAFYTFTVRSPRRDQLAEYLAKNDIEVKIQHPILMPEQQPYQSCKSECDVAVALRSQILCLPVHEKLADKDIHHVCDMVDHFHGGQ